MNFKKKIIGIILGEPNSIFSELIFKIWKKRKKNKLLPFILIGNYSLIKKQMEYLDIVEYQRKCWKVCFELQILCTPLLNQHL